MKSTKLLSYSQSTYLLLFFFFVVRLLAAFILELSNDESYYWVYSQHLQSNYFDHPPMVAIWGRISSLNLSLQHIEGFLRLGSIVSAAIAGWFIYKTTAALHSEKAGFFAVALYNASLYSGLTAGTYLMPDAPQMLFWTLCMWMLVRMLQNDSSWFYWIVFGISAGLCIMSKVHGVFVWIGLGLFILFQKREWLQKPQLYAAAIISVVIISPILFWNIKHDFATYHFHSQRVSIENAAFNVLSFPKEILHQVVWNNPINVFLIGLGIKAWFNRKMLRLAGLALFLYIGMPLALILLFVSIFRNTVLPHWSGPAYISLLPLAAICLAQTSSKAFPTILRWSLSLFLSIVFVWTILVHFYPGNMGKKSLQNFGQGDITLDMYGWEEAGKAFSNVYKGEIEKGFATSKMPLVCKYWWGAHIEYYFARPLGIKMIGLGSMSQLHHYLWVNAWRKKAINADTAYCIMPSDDNYVLPLAYYKEIKKIATITINRGGKPTHYFRVYRCRGLRQEIPAAY